ncbi:hypothetical protein ScalyP_jg2648 [Parmales sp. scaly parma]|nr:hypothetical protein ScalyP_jg2648 [Parmales sp. scaly parma]
MEIPQAKDPNPPPTEQLNAFFSNLDTKLTSSSSSSQPTSFKSSKVQVTYDLELPIPITIPGSKIKYAFGTENGDISFGLFIQDAASASTKASASASASASANNNAKTNHNANTNADIELLELTRVDSHMDPVTGTITIPEACVLLLYWDNHFSWLKTKLLSYSVTVIPPSPEQLGAAKVTQLSEVLGGVEKDLKVSCERLSKVREAGSVLAKKKCKLEEELAEVNKHLAVAKSEEGVLLDRKGFREGQKVGLRERLTREGGAVQK